MTLERFYENEYPAVDDVVMATVISVGAAMYQAKLLEYDKTAFILRSCFLDGRNIARRYLLFSKGRDVCLSVLRVDTKKGFIDLSPRRITGDEEKTCKDRYHKSKMVLDILRHASVSMDLDEESFENLVRKTAWHFDRKAGGQGKSFEYFKRAVNDPAVLQECDIDEETREVLQYVIKLKLSPPVVWLRSVVEVTCYTEEGVEAVKRALIAGREMSTENYPIQIHVVACPEYELSTRTSDIDGGVQCLNSVQDHIETTILQAGGNFKLIKQPYCKNTAYWERS